MTPNTKTILLLVCLTLIYSFECKTHKKVKHLHSPNDVKSSPALIQNKIKETITAKVLNSKVNQINSTTPEPNNTPATTTSSANFNSAGPTVNEDDKFLAARNIKCDSTNCNFPNGVCTENNTVCRCLDGYANFEVINENENTTPKGYYCSYQQKRQVVAFLLEFFVSVGVGHFYAGRVLFGVFKLLVMLGPIILSILMCCTAVFKDNDTSSCVGLILMIGSCLFVCTGLVWQLVDIIMFGINSYKDGNGVPLQHW